MEGPEESEAGLDVIAEICWEPAYLLLSMCRHGKKAGEEEAGRNEPGLIVNFEEVEAGDWEADCHYEIPLL